MDTSVSLDRIVQRAKDVMSFNTRTMAEITRDPSATTEAALIVAIVAVSSGLGRLFDGPGALIGGILAMLIGWVVAAAVIYFIGTKITGENTSSSSVERVLRAVGYAAAPNVFAFLTGIWFFGGLVALVLGVWTLFTLIMAIRSSMNMSLSAALITGGLAWLAYGFVVFMLGMIFGINPTLPF